MTSGPALLSHVSETLCCARAESAAASSETKTNVVLICRFILTFRHCQQNDSANESRERETSWIDCERRARAGRTTLIRHGRDMHTALAAHDFARHRESAIHANALRTRSK